MIQELTTFLAWLNSVDCPNEIFDTIPKYGKFDHSLDELIAETIQRLIKMEEK